MSSGKILSMSAAALLASLAITGAAQQGRQLTQANYAQAEKFMNYNVNPLVYHTVEHPSWLGDGRFWYRDHGPDGATYVLVDPAKKTKGPAFDHAKLANALNAAMASSGSAAGAASLSAGNMILSELSFAGGDKMVTLVAGGAHWRCDLSGAGVCTATDKSGSTPKARANRRDLRARPSFRRMGRRLPSYETGISGCVTWRAGKRFSSPPMA